MNIGNVVWSNEKFTKMHDKLPMELFKVENIIKLISAKSYVASAYWFPITCAIMAITKLQVGFEYRDFLLKCSFYFLVEFYLCWKNSDGKLPQRKYGDSKDVVFYTNELLIEFCNTLHAHIQLLNNIPGYCFSRNSTSPLEHKFGYARCKSRDIHTLSKFIKIISAIQSIHKEKAFESICSFNEEADKIRGRVNISIACESKDDDYVYYKDDDFEDDLIFSPQNVAKSFLIKAGFFVRKSN